MKKVINLLIISLMALVVGCKGNEGFQVDARQAVKKLKMLSPENGELLSSDLKDKIPVKGQCFLGASVEVKIKDQATNEVSDSFDCEDNNEWQKEVDASSLNSGDMEVSTHISLEDVVVTHTINISVPSSCDDAASIGGGDGSSSNPYLVCTVAHFIEINNLMGSGVYFKIMADIDFQNTQYNDPIIGDFEGVIDGNEKTLSNINIDKNLGSGADVELALFHQISNSEIYDLSINNIDVATDSRQYAAFAWKIFATHIHDVEVNSMTVDGSDNGGGFIYGVYDGSTLEDIKITNATLTSGANVGLFARQSYVLIDTGVTNTFRRIYLEGDVSRVRGGLDNMCMFMYYSTHATFEEIAVKGSVTATSVSQHVSGFLGIVAGRNETSFQDHVIIRNVYSETTVTNLGSGGRIGGLLSDNWSTATGVDLTIENSYHNGAISASDSAKVGIAGWWAIPTNTSISILDSHFNTTAAAAISSAINDSGSGSRDFTGSGGLTDAEMKDETNFASSWDTAVWRFTPGDYPRLKNIE
jgi:hypothetical protein